MSFSQIKFSGRYKLEQLLQQTHTKSIFKGRNVQTGELVIIKAEFFKAKNANILYEGKFLQLTQGCPGIPWMHWCGPESQQCNCLIVEHLGWSIQSLLEFCGGSFSLKTVVMLGFQLLQMIQVYHFKELIHRRICPHSLQMGKGKKNHLLFFNDLLNSRKYIDTKTGEHIQNRQTSGTPLGTTIFASFRTLAGQQPSRRDDIQSMILTLIYLAKGKLPWGNKQQFVNMNEISSEVTHILKIRKDLQNKQICQGLPNQFVKMLDHSQRLQHAEQPNYSFLRKQLRRILSAYKFSDDYVYDWVLKGINNQVQIQNVNLNQSPVFTEVINNEQNFINCFYKPFEIKIDINEIEAKYKKVRFGINEEYHQKDKDKKKAEGRSVVRKSKEREDRKGQDKCVLF